ncbi:MAG: DUF1345 domain-containing protein [Betaproteobacteria bacterium]|jgi:uncharacterized membrane protein
MTGKPATPWIQAVVSRPRLCASIAIGLGVYFLVVPRLSLSELECGLISWNVAIASYLVLISLLMRRTDPEEMRRQALDQDAGRKTVLTLVIASVAISFAGIVFELVDAKTMFGAPKAIHIALTLATVALCWFFAQIMFAQHYAHEFYEAVLKGEPGGLDFPGEPSPDYTDFVYFAFSIGTSSQTSDVNVTSRPMRRLTTVHSLFSFTYNTALIALGINVASSLF